MVTSKATVLLLNDQLHRNYGALKDATPDTHQVLFIESERMLSTRRWHVQRLFFLLSARDHFLQELRDEGFTVIFIRSKDTPTGVKQFRKEFPGAQLISAEPSSHQQMEQFLDLKVVLLPNDFFLTPRPLFAQWAKGQKSLVLENFYRAQRQRLNILMEGSDPVGGRWNYDAENRLPPPKGDHKWPPYLNHAHDEMDEQVLIEIAERKLPVFGNPPDNTWGTTRKAALKQLNHFLDKAFSEFGA